MTVTELIDVLHNEICTGRMKMEDEVPKRLIDPEALPEMGAEEYLKKRGVVQIGQKHPD